MSRRRNDVTHHCSDFGIIMLVWNQHWVGRCGFIISRLLLECCLSWLLFENDWELLGPPSAPPQWKGNLSHNFKRKWNSHVISKKHWTFFILFLYRCISRLWRGVHWRLFLRKMKNGFKKWKMKNDIKEYQRCTFKRKISFFKFRPCMNNVKSLSLYKTWW